MLVYENINYSFLSKHYSLCCFNLALKLFPVYTFLCRIILQKEIISQMCKKIIESEMGGKPVIDCQGKDGVMQQF